MSLLKTFGNIFRQHAENLDKSLSDPARDGHFAIEDAQKEINDFELKLHDLVAQTISLKKKLADAQADEVKYAAVAEKAAAAQIKDDVVSALTEKNRAQTLVDTITKEITANESIQANAKVHIAAARAKVEAAKNTEEQAKLRIATADLRSDLASCNDSFGKNNGLANIDALSQAADAAESHAAASEELSSETPEAKKQALEAKYGSSTTLGVEDEAAALLAKHSAQ